MELRVVISFWWPLRNWPTTYVPSRSATLRHNDDSLPWKLSSVIILVARNHYNKGPNQWINEHTSIIAECLKWPIIDQASALPCRGCSRLWSNKRQCHSLMSQPWRHRVEKWLSSAPLPRAPGSWREGEGGGALAPRSVITHCVIHHPEAWQRRPKIHHKHGNQFHRRLK